MSTLPAGSIQYLTDDSQVQKIILNQGHGELAHNHSTLSCHYEIFLQGQSTPIDSTRFRNAPLWVKLGDGKVINGLELILSTMCVGEIAEGLCTSVYGYGKKGLPNRIPSDATLRIVVELLSVWESPNSPRQCIELALAYKNQGNTFFKSGLLNEALDAYEKVNSCIKRAEECTDKDRMELDALGIAASSNSSACYIKLKEWTKVIEICEKVISLDPTNIKAYYRLGQAYLETKEYEQGISSVKQGLKHSPSDTSMKALLSQLQQKEAQWLKSRKALYKNMFA
ncbi:hypothetical protein PHYBLDRAFT_186443 [Phycomyces blakesleeanus NRRL 1555(-)]|uniref:peptidylprolyl isomerase n=1 Tax=Phycomyces blakesleeanus (strain ATCC 8743b / DSM 1359 / FGSC 10004 / NBRC 33097 / NRRL 1555) TaxID=763407 RepID=A0A167NBG8_PHYB8|nr:hypothetical protein PHYBLDRAFT_186443 [Phycomyces blakesleeanus NRRL 1555(-)]OAD75598.1 hypothetical protein PHYBLDRAFT_186443 [Phycomyces blakesleeanus NRRL 1555(-)]|eukprot:XP_018293638.1 hypothetical protein PHYBLDRAFT_186443 [Phycomyces blakesleeanus NRRL 1555(-)]